MRQEGNGRRERGKRAEHGSSAAAPASGEGRATVGTPADAGGARGDRRGSWEAWLEWDVLGLLDRGSGRR